MSVADLARAAGKSPGRLIAERVRADLAACAPSARDSLPARTWAAIPITVRLPMVMLATDAQGDARRLAAQPWESFSERDRLSLASFAREFSAGLRDAACLW